MRCRLMICLLLLSFFLSSCGELFPLPLTPPLTEEDKEEPLLGMWISQFDLKPLCVDGGIQREREAFEGLADQTVERLLSLGINTVFLQARPNGDALYPSSLYPSSPYAVGEIGSAFSYDPYGILVARLRQAGISVHGWINPLRLFTEENRLALDTDHPILALWAQAAVRVGDVWYLDPSLPSAVEYVCRGVEELLRAYPLDGIQIDDYFYPTVDPAFDEESYLAYLYAGGNLSLGDFRREAVCRMVSLLYRRIKAVDPSLRFGVSPSGNNERNYGELYADVAHWCAQEGYVDYILPQLYFGMEHCSLPFPDALWEFISITKTGSTELYVGLSLEKAYRGFLGQEDPYAGSGAHEWIHRRDILARCAEAAERTGVPSGICFFSYRLFFDPISGEPIPETAEEVGALASRGYFG